MVNRLVPTDLVAVAVGGGQVILAWAEGEAGARGFRIERAAGDGGGGRFVEIGGVGQHVTAFSDESVTPGATYRYRVRARSGGCNSAPSNVAEVTTPEVESKSGAGKRTDCPEDGD